MSVFSLYEQIGFYAEYHNHPINKFIHIIFVPVILWTAMVFATYSGPLLPSLSFLPIPTNLALILITLFVLFYIILEPFAGVLYSPILFMMCYFANVFAQNVPNAVIVALCIHIFSWIIQFVGHGVFEKRAPALLDSLIQGLFLSILPNSYFPALVLAPLFVWLEVLFMLGYKPDLAKKIDEDAKRRIKKWRESKAKQK